MKVILAASPATGHVDPLVGIGRLLIAHGHDVLLYTGSAFRHRAEQIGARFHPLPPEVDFDLRNLEACFPERVGLIGPELMQFDFKNIFIGPIPLQHAGLQRLLTEFPADLVIAEQFFLGALPLLFDPSSSRPRVIGCGISFLSIARSDGMPHGPGLDHVDDPALRSHLEQTVVPQVSAVFEPIRAKYDAAIRMAGAEPKGTPHGAMATYADQFWQAGVPDIELPFPAMPGNLRFVGRWPQAPAEVPLPAWRHELDGTRKVVLVTQGTYANDDLEKLVLPTMRALADRDDLLVLGTTGGRPLTIEPDALPANARLEIYLPLDWLMPRVDAMVSNGGFGTLLQALAAGVPVVVAGETEDKPENAMRIERAGVGINLRTETPSEASIADAVDAVLLADTIREKVAKVAQAFAEHDCAQIIPKAAEGLVRLARGEQRPAAA